MATNRGATIGIAGSLLGLTLLGSMTAYGTVQVDLRFEDGSKTQVAAPGDFAIDVWVQVVGTDPAKRDGLLWAMGSVQSTQIGGGAVVGASGAGITGNVAAPGGAFTVSGLAGQAGVAQDLTHDGIQDWGTTSTMDLNHIKYSSLLADPANPLAPGTAPVYGDTPGAITHAIANGTEYKVGTLNFHINQVNYAALGSAGATQINWDALTGFLPGQISSPDEACHPADALNVHYLPSVPGINSVEFTGAQPPEGYVPPPASGDAPIVPVTLPTVGVEPPALVPSPEAAPGSQPGDVSKDPERPGNDPVSDPDGVTTWPVFTAPTLIGDGPIDGVITGASETADPMPFLGGLVDNGMVRDIGALTAVAPEPGSLALLGLVGMAWMLRRRTKAGGC